MTVSEIRDWVKKESDKPSNSKLFIQVCDELLLIKTLEQNLHNHTITEQLDVVVKEATWEQLPHPVRNAILLLNQGDQAKAMDYHFKRIPPEILREYVESVSRVIQTSKDPRVQRAYDFKTNTFYCDSDMEVLKHIQDSVIYINGLFLKEKT